MLCQVEPSLPKACWPCAPVVETSVWLALDPISSESQEQYAYLFQVGYHRLKPFCSLQNFELLLLQACLQLSLLFLHLHAAQLSAAASLRHAIVSDSKQAECVLFHKVAPVPELLPAQAFLAALPALCKSVQLQLEVLCLLACTCNQFIACIKSISLACSWTSVDKVM